MKEGKSAVKEGLVIYDGIIIESLPNNTFRTKINIQNEERLMVAHISGRMRRNFIKVMPSVSGVLNSLNIMINLMNFRFWKELIQLNLSGPVSDNIMLQLLSLPENIFLGIQRCWTF